MPLSLWKRKIEGQKRAQKNAEKGRLDMNTHSPHKEDIQSKPRHGPELFIKGMKWQNRTRLLFWKIRRDLEGHQDPRRLLERYEGNWNKDMRSSKSHGHRKQE